MSEESATEPSWLESLDEEDRALAQSRAWDSPKKALTSYRELERLKGVPPDRLVTLPSEDDDPEAWNNVYRKLGAPEKPDEYDIAVDIQDENRLNQFREVAHKIGLTKKQAAALAEFDAQFMSSLSEQRMQQTQEQIQKEEEALKREWGDGYDRNLQAARKAAQTYGFTEEEIDKLQSISSYSSVLKRFYEIGRTIGKEDTFETSGSSRSMNFNAVSPAEARQRKMDLLNDPNFRKQYLSGNPDAVERISFLEEKISGG